jgi:hypothetical protein
MLWPEHVPPRLAASGHVGSASVPVPLREGLRTRDHRPYRQKMLGHEHRHGSSGTVLRAGLVAGAVLIGCAADPTRTAPAAATSPAESSATPTASSDLAAGLLPAEAFGKGADVDPLPFDGVPGLDHWGDRGPWGHDDESLTPSECQTALEQAGTQFGDVQDAAGQVARADNVRTFEVLAVPTQPVNVVEEFGAVVAACRDVSFSEENGDGDHGDGQVSIDPLQGLPDGMAGASVTFSGTYPDGTWAATSLIGVAQDGDRVLVLAQMSWDDTADDTALDSAAFTALLQQAYDVQAGALD